MDYFNEKRTRFADSLVTDSKSPYRILVVLFCSKMSSLGKGLSQWLLFLFILSLCVWDFCSHLVEILSMAFDMFMYSKFAKIILTKLLFFKYSSSSNCNFKKAR